MDHRFGLVAFDMDGVLVDHSSSWSWIHEHFDVNNKDSFVDYMKGSIDDSEFMRRDIRLWIQKKRDLCREDIEDILLSVPVVAGIKETIEALHSHDIRCIIISGGLDITAERIYKEYCFDDFIANGVKCDPLGRLTGEGILRVELINKRRALERFQAKYMVPEDCTVAIGNSFVDISMFNGSRLSIAFNPIDDFVEKSAKVVVRSRDLRDVLAHIIDPQSE